MRFWDPDDPDIAAADAEPWGGWLSGALRPFSLRALPRLALVAMVLCFQAPLSVLVVFLAARDTFARPEWAVPTISFTLLVGVAMAVFIVALPPASIRRLVPLGVVLVILSMGWVSSIAMWSGGPGLSFVAVFYLEALPFAFYVLRLRWALLMAVNAIGGCGLVLFTQDGWPAPAAAWLLVGSTVLAVSWILGIIAERAERLAVSEHAANVAMVEMNRTLEDRVALQVNEIEQLGELRRFLSPQVADALMSEQQDAVRRPHRARIAVFFCDLRGFTAFTNRAEPEEVITVLDEYYAAVGGLLQQHGATIGDYAGDGIMAYFGDPVPHPEPAAAALAMAHKLREPMAALAAEWRRLGHDLGYGVGIAYGYATLGVIGFDGRFDYTPIGGVVNLAARLCGKAADGEVLLDHAAFAGADGRVHCEQVTGLDLKGYAADTRAYRLTAAVV